MKHFAAFSSLMGNDECIFSAKDVFVTTLAILFYTIGKRQPCVTRESGTG